MLREIIFYIFTRAIVGGLISAAIFILMDWLVEVISRAYF